jgi:hypothetical protein
MLGHSPWAAARSFSPPHKASSIRGGLADLAADLHRDRPRRRSAGGIHHGHRDSDPCAPEFSASPIACWIVAQGGPGVRQSLPASGPVGDTTRKAAAAGCTAVPRIARDSAKAATDRAFPSFLKSSCPMPPLRLAQPKAGHLARRSPTPAASPLSQFLPTQRIADQPEHRRPEADEEGSAFGVSPFVLADGLGANPEGDAKQDGTDREHMEVMTSRPQPARFRK